ncbi:hypothetical protein COU61_00935 [Candidatus Pacearchaeota archaeon CG10_big_fil_rev_8_21_14_0_10_35_13]|nr:MAG: hypothetical protein COU61_00935 [Candidatus Pacearchaeota archaeon CG10_big_fil_rev_8_21_14_0_10_35_13]
MISVDDIELELNPPIPALPNIDDKTMLDVRYGLIPPFAYAHIYWDKKQREVIYEIEEPILDENESRILKELEEAMRDVINVNPVTENDPKTLIEYTNKTAKLLITELNLKLNKEQYKKMFYYLFRDFVGLNKIEAIMKDYFIEDVECNGVETPVYVVHRVYRNLRTNIVYKDVEELASFVEKLAQKGGRYISYANPLLDASLPDGSRINATYTKDITSKGPTFCFKEGYVQLNDGRIKKIDELFEEAKNSFGSKIEEGNEIVKPLNMNCCGVYEDNLEQKDSVIKSIIKLRAPEKLANVKLSDGGEIEVTLDHKFHVAEETLIMKEAKDLAPGMIIPIPKRIKINGYRQKISTYELIKDFSYSRRISVISTPKIKNLVTEEISLNNHGGNFRQALSQKYGVSNSYFYEIISRGSSISFQVLDEICKVRKISQEDLGELSINVYGGGKKGKSKTIAVPKEINEDLAYIAGAIISDGHLSKNSVDISCYEEGFKDKVKEKLLKIFGKYESYYDDNRVYLSNAFVPFFFNKVFEIPSGKKSYKVKIPEKIFKSDNKVISAFIAGLFDGDGTAKSGLSYKTYSKELAEGLTYLLSRLGIYSYLRNNTKEWRVNIPSYHYKLFSEMIKLENKTKNHDLRELINKQKKEREFRRHGRIPATPFITIINKLKLVKSELLKKCDVSFGRFGYMTLSRTFAEKLVEEFKKNMNKETVKKELGYIKWLLETEQEFVKVESVEIISNNKEVYDLELEPCTFFIAGNKPMNVFDTIRKFTKVPWTPTKLISLHTLSPEMLAYFWMLMEYKANILISGGTASGKTTLLNAIAFFIPPEARVVSIEDTREIQLSRDNWLPSVARTPIATGQNTGEVDLFSLLKNSFRQNPDYVIVGEVRGKEAYVLFQGMASGHSSMSTIHADSVQGVVRRLSTPPIDLSPALLETLDAVAIMTHVIVNKKQTRRLREIVEVVSVDAQGNTKTNTPFLWNPAGDTFFYKKDIKAFEKLSLRFGITYEQMIKELELRARLLYEMLRRGIIEFEEVQREVIDYYKNPEAVLRKYGVIK